jgi:hypothetical protein
VLPLVLGVKPVLDAVTRAEDRILEAGDVAGGPEARARAEARS